jgi:hypothetical protein
MDNYDRFIGVWQLMEWKVIVGDEIRDPSMGASEDCDGRIIYTPDRFMCATLSLRNRPKFAAESFDDGTDEEKLHAFDTFVSYSGKVEVNPVRKIVSHLVEFSSYPNFVGTTQERHYEFLGSNLKLSVPLIKMGQKEVGTYLIWKHVE